MRKTQPKQAHRNLLRTIDAFQSVMHKDCLFLLDNPLIKIISKMKRESLLKIMSRKKVIQTWLVLRTHLLILERFNGPSKGAQAPTWESLRWSFVVIPVLVKIEMWNACVCLFQIVSYQVDDHEWRKYWLLYGCFFLLITSLDFSPLI